MKILLNGYYGQMGTQVRAIAEGGYRNAEIALGVDARIPNESESVYESFAHIPCPKDADCIVDFSHPAATGEMLEFAKKNRLPVVLATTGHTDDEIKEIKAAGEIIPIFYSGNMSLGVALLIELAKKAAEAMPEADIEIVETHHTRKIDAPSGTALMLANAIREVRPEAYTNVGRSGHGKRDKDEIGIHSIRMGNIVGIHEVKVCTQSQTITLKHEAHTRALFAEGAIAAAEFIVQRDAGIYDMKSIVNADNKSEDIVIS